MESKPWRDGRGATLAVLACAAMLSLPQGAGATVFLVGGDDCDFNNLQGAIDAAAVNPGPDTIRVANNAVYVAQALRIGGTEDLELVGGYDACASILPTPGAHTTLSGIGGAADSVVVITGSGLRQFSNFIIRDGDELNSGRGGGIDFEGSGELRLTRMFVQENRAGYGGGISFVGTGTGAQLTFISDVVVFANVANGSGGGARLSGTAHLQMIGPQSQFLFNEAQGLDPDSGYGGGLQVLAPATAEIASGFGVGGVLASNSAKFGGGLALLANKTQKARVVMFTRDPNRPVRIHNNIASAAGGGIYLEVPSDPPVRSARLCASDFRIDHNQAPAGAAVFVKDEIGLQALLHLNLDAERTTDCAPTVSRVRCNLVKGCNLIDSNVVAQTNGQPAAGAIMHLTRAQFIASQVAWLDNTGNDLVLQSPVGLENCGSTCFELRGCLIADNALQAQTIATGAGQATLDQCTIAGNTLGLSSTMTFLGALELRNAIIWQPGRFSLNSAHGALTGRHVLTNDPASLAPLTALSGRAPRFVDPENGDYHLRVASPALDYAFWFPEAPNERDEDLDLRERDADVFLLPDQDGPRDLGAFEFESIDLAPIVLNGFFNTNLRLWESVTPNSSSFDPTGGFVGLGGFGAGGLNFNWTPPPSTAAGEGLTPLPEARVITRQQCVHLPVAGTYRLSGRARLQAPPSSPVPLRRGQALLHWTLRHDGTEACTNGAIAAQGDLLLTPTSSSTDWQTATASGIQVEAGDFTPNSSLTVEIIMQHASGAQIPGVLRGWFDDIMLQLQTDDVFADGFES